MTPHAKFHVNPSSNLGPISHRFRDMATKKISAKPLQIETWLLLTAYRKSPAHYLMAPSPTLCDLPFSHNMSVTDLDRPPFSETKSPAVARIADRIGCQWFYDRLELKTFRWKLRPNRCRWRYGYYWQPIGSRQRPIRWHYRRPSTIYSLATIHPWRRTTDYRLAKQKAQLSLR